MQQGMTTHDTHFMKQFTIHTVTVLMTSQTCHTKHSTVQT